LVYGNLGTLGNTRIFQIEIAVIVTRNFLLPSKLSYDQN
jgi:hypothetical protein